MAEDDFLGSIARHRDWVQILKNENQDWEFAHRFSERIAHFLLKKWANEQFAKKNEQFAHSLIFGERPERFTHGRSFDLSDLSESLTVAHLIWANERIPSPVNIWTKI